MSGLKVKLFTLLIVSLLSLVTSIRCKNSTEEETGPVLIVSGQNLKEYLGIQITVSIFLIISSIDFIFQSILILYVFIQLLLTIKKASDFLFSIFGVIVYFTLRISFIPMILRPIPWDWASKLQLPKLLDSIFLYMNLTTFTFFYGLSALACLYYVCFVGITGKKMKGSIIDVATGIEPMVVILMPIYNEEPDALFRAVESAIRCNYRPDRLHIFLAFDEASETALYFALLKKLKVLSKEVSAEIKTKLEQIDNDNKNNNEDIQIFPPRLEWYVEGVRVTICRFPHEGKSPTQGKAFKVINSMYGKDDDETSSSANTLILFIDSDIILQENAIHNFVVSAVANPKIKGMTGLVTCRTSRRFNTYQYMQDAEYIDGQMFSRTAEATLGAVTCLPGALTLIRLNALQKVAPKYFIEIDKRRTVDFHRYHLGEDRYMTYLLTEEADGPFQVKFISSATCKTDAPDTFQKLLKQRRRWFLGGFVNDMSTIISPVMWKKVPFVVLMKIHFYSSKGTDWILPILIISLVLDTDPGIALYIFVATFLIRYVILCLNALIMTRTKVCGSYLFMFLLGPFFNQIVTLYAVWTWGVRSWGGPRTDGDEEQLSPARLIEDVMAQKEEGVGKTRKSLGQIKTVGRIIDTNLRAPSFNNNDPFGSVRSNVSVNSKSRPRLEQPPVKKFVPFPYEAEFLGGGDYSSNDVILVPPSPTLSTRSFQMQKGNQSPLLSPHYIHQSRSIPADLNTLTDSNVPYLFSKLSPETQRRASSFRLDTDYLSRMEDLATHSDSEQKGSSFNVRLSASGRSTPTGMSSREPSMFNYDGAISSKASSNGDFVEGEGVGYNDGAPRSKVDIVIYVSQSEETGSDVHD